MCDSEPPDEFANSSKALRPICKQLTFPPHLGWASVLTEVPARVNSWRLSLALVYICILEWKRVWPNFPPFELTHSVYWRFNTMDKSIVLWMWLVMVAFKGWWCFQPLAIPLVFLLSGNNLICTLIKTRRQTFHITFSNNVRAHCERQFDSYFQVSNFPCHIIHQ